MTEVSKPGIKGNNLKKKKNNLKSAICFKKKIKIINRQHFIELLRSQILPIYKKPCISEADSPQMNES